MTIASTIVRREPQKSDLQSFHPLLRRVYSSRGITSADELSTDLKGLLSYKDFKDIDKAVARLAAAIANDESILVVGDFDVDGATSSAIMVSALQAFGATTVNYLVPNRFSYGYGLSPEIVEFAAVDQPDLIVTVDNGISSHAGVERARELGIEVIITDHHLPGQTLPAAYAIVNPNQTGCAFQSKNLAGVGVAFYVMLALRAHLVEIGWFDSNGIDTPKMSDYLDLVALGTIADVVKLDKNNRTLVAQGLRRIRAGRFGPGMAALLQVSGRNYQKMKATDLGFAVGPRLNAAGRLDDMSLGISCLLSCNKTEALAMAKQLDDLNKERRVIEAQMKIDAFKAIDDLNLHNDLPLGLCVYQEHWHQGVVGLVASRVKEKIHRPVIAFAKVEDGVLKGSARSIVGLHIRDVLETIAIQRPDLISKFGGHSMAAGLSLEESCYDQFVDAFVEEVSKRITKSDVKGRFETDGELSSSEMSLEMAEMLAEAGPWGQGFPEPVFDGTFELASHRVVGTRHLKVVLKHHSSEHYIDGIVFNADLDLWPDYNVRTVFVVYRLDINDFGGRRRMQVIVDYIRPVDEDYSPDIDAVESL